MAWPNGYIVIARLPNLKSGGRVFKSRSGRKAEKGAVSR